VWHGCLTAGSVPATVGGWLAGVRSVQMLGFG